MQDEPAMWETVIWYVWVCVCVFGFVFSVFDVGFEFLHLSFTTVNWWKADM